MATTKRQQRAVNNLEEKKDILRGKLKCDTGLLHNEIDTLLESKVGAAIFAAMEEFAAVKAERVLNKYLDNESKY